MVGNREYSVRNTELLIACDGKRMYINQRECICNLHRAEWFVIPSFCIFAKKVVI